MCAGGCIEKTEKTVNCTTPKTALEKGSRIGFGNSSRNIRTVIQTRSLIAFASADPQRRPTHASHNVPPSLALHSISIPPQFSLHQPSIRSFSPAACIESKSRSVSAFRSTGPSLVVQPTAGQNQTTPGRQTRTSKRVRARRHGEGFIGSSSALHAAQLRGRLSSKCPV